MWEAYIPPRDDAEGCLVHERPYVTLVLGQYGYDVAGVIKFYARWNRVDPNPCCRAIFDGRMRGDTLQFGFTSCEGGDGPSFLRARLTLQADGETLSLVGPLTIEDTDRSSDGPKFYAEEVRFTGFQQEQLTNNDKACQTSAPCNGGEVEDAAESAGDTAAMEREDTSGGGGDASTP